MGNKSRQKTKKDLARNSSSRKPHKTVLIVCEGKTEVHDFCGLRNKYRLQAIEIQSAKNSAPIHVVNAAIKIGKDMDKIFCVFDRDTHETYEQAIKKN